MKEKYYKWKAKRKLIHQYEYVMQVDKLLEGYLTKQILSGGSQEFLEKGRKDLIQKQNEMKTNQKFIDYLKSVKI